jgi:glycosyltransferase involved in cell wall biosynthesis
MLSGEAPPIIGGVGDYTVRLLHAIREQRPDWSLTLMTRRRRWFDAPVSKPGGIRTFRPVHGWTPRWNRYATGLARWLPYDVLHIQEEPYSWFETDVAVRIAQLRPRVPMVVTLHELHPQRASFDNARRLVDLAAAVTANDNRTAELCQRHAGRTVDRILFSPGNIEPLPESQRPNPVRGRVCTFGLINRLKRFDILFEALKRVRTARPDLTWHIVGPFDPEIDAEHRAVRDQLAGADWIRFTGALDADRELPGELHQAEVMLLPFDDGASLRRTSLQAGWRFALPVVTTRPPAIEPGFEAGGNVIFADREDPESWYQAVSRLLESSEERDRISRGGWATSEAYTFEALAREHVAIYERLTGR